MVVWLSRPDMTSEEKDLLIEDLVREITALWQTDELRRRKPTPLDGQLAPHALGPMFDIPHPARLLPVCLQLHRQLGRL